MIRVATELSKPPNKKTYIQTSVITNEVIKKKGLNNKLNNKHIVVKTIQSRTMEIWLLIFAT